MRAATRIQRRIGRSRDWWLSGNERPKKRPCTLLGFPGISPSADGARIGMGEGNPAEPAQGSVSPFFKILQDSNAKMQDSKAFPGIPDTGFHVGKCPFFLWESIGQYQQRPGSGSCFGTFGRGRGRKGGIIFRGVSRQEVRYVHACA
jgi:hypothetical protein